MKRNLQNELLANLAALKQGQPLRVTKFTANADGSVTETVTFGGSCQVTLFSVSPCGETQLTGPRWEAICARQALKFTQTEFADLLGVSRRTLENWEQGRTLPSGAARMLITIARIRPKAVREAQRHLMQTL